MDRTAFTEYLSGVAVKRGSNVSESIFSLLRDLILTGELSEGFMFPNELDMCSLLGVGRSTVREAYTSLARQNLITRSKAGTVVNGKSALEGRVPFNQVLDASELDEIMDLRLVLESGITALAASRATDDTVARLMGIAAEMKRANGNLEALTVYDTKFHLALAECTGNALICSVFLSVRDRLEGLIYRAFARNAELMDEAVRYHERIVIAIAAHDADAASKCMNEHMLSVLGSIK